MRVRRLVQTLVLLLSCQQRGILLAALGMALASVLWATVAAAQPSPPQLVSPLNGGNAVIPRFAWNSVTGASKYDIQVSSREDFSSLLWSESTLDLTITPVGTLPNGLLWWRLRSVDGSDQAGAWSTPWSFTKQIPAPVLSSPADGATGASATFRWLATEGAAYYTIEVSANSGFSSLLWSESTYDLSITRAGGSLANGTLYWRVAGVDANGNKGTFSASRLFIKQIPGPTTLNPTDGATVTTPAFKWQVVEGATYYQVQVANDLAFSHIIWTEQTYNLGITRAGDTLPNGKLYWRVSGMDAGGNAGIPSAVHDFTKEIPGPNLAAPADGSTVTTPTFEWQAVDGAVSYMIQVSTSSAFSSILWSDDTHNLSITRASSALPTGQLYWRVYGKDADGNIGTASAVRVVTVASVPACDSAALTLGAPASGSTWEVDPVFTWSCAQNATRYRILIFQDATQVAYQDTVYTAYAPYLLSSGSKRTLPDGAYNWRVEAYQGTTLLSTSPTWTFTKSTSFGLLEPADGATLTSDPTLQWQAVRAVDRYRVLILQGGATYAYASTNYASYTPYYFSSGSERALPNGDYTWLVEAYNGSTLIAASSTRAFSKAATFSLLAPSNGGVVVADPGLRWQALGGANKYKIMISQGGQSYAYASTSYVSYTPYYLSTGSAQTLADGAYDWQVEAYNDSTLLATSGSRTFSRLSSLVLLEPPDSSSVPGDPTLVWQGVHGANKYKVLMYKDSGLHAYATTYYTTYTPYYYTTGSVETLANGAYTWKIEAYYNNTLITTSPLRSFTVGTGAPTPTSTATATSTKTPTPTATPSSPDAFEADNSCASAREITTDGLPQTHTFHVWGDQDWIRFNATAGKSYVIQTSNSGSHADPVLLLYNACANPSLGGADNAFGRDLYVEWNADAGGWYYVKLQQRDADVYGAGTSYDISVIADTTPPGAPRNPRCASVNLNTIGVQWEQNPEADVARYIVNYYDELSQDSGARDVDGSGSTYVALDGLLFANRLYSMRVKAEDFSGNRGAESEQVSCRTSLPADSTSPTVALQQPTGGAEFTTSVGTISFSGNAQDVDGNLSRVRVANSTVGSEAWDNSLSGSADTFYVTGVSLQPGDNSIVVSAMDDAGNLGATNVTVRRVGASQGGGWAIIAGGHSETFSLQSNIDNVTNRVYQIFQGAGYDEAHIYYLSPSPQDPDRDGESEVDAPMSQASLDSAIRTWAASHVGPGEPLTLYLMDHGLIERFCADGCDSGFMTPDALDAALTDLEGSTGVDEVNVILEACHSGSFVDRQGGLGSISKAGRVVITSTDREHNAYASAQGAYFSDALLTCAATGDNLKSCFGQAKAAVTQTRVSQAPWLDDNGDAVSSLNDGTIAQSRFLARFFNATPPVITDSTIMLDGASGTLTAQVSTGSDAVAVVWVDVYAPSFQEPAGTTLNLGVPSLRLDPVPGMPGLYEAFYPNGFTEPGRYRVVFYARDTKGLQATPRLAMVGSGGVYLPVVVR